MELLTEKQLKDWSGYRRRADLEKFLRDQGIAFMYGKGNCICTTVSAIEKSLALVNNRKTPSAYQM